MYRNVLFLSVLTGTATYDPSVTGSAATTEGTSATADATLGLGAATLQLFAG